jgi:integrase
MKTRHTNGGLRKVCGCPRRTWAKCLHAWHFAFKWAGTHYRFSLDRHLGKHIDNKTEAETEADRIRIAIKEGRFGQPAPRDEMTVRQLADTYLERYVQVERAPTEQSYIWSLNKICRTVIPRPTGGCAALGDWRVTDIVTDTIERFREIRRAAGAGLGGANRSMARLRALFAWAVRVGYAERTPFRRGSEPVVKLTQEPKRDRRLNTDVDEERKLLAVCNSHLRAVVECALETGMRTPRTCSSRSSRDATSRSRS